MRAWRRRLASSARPPAYLARLVPRCACGQACSPSLPAKPRGSDRGVVATAALAPSAQPPPGGSAEQAKRGLGGFGSKFAQLKSQAEAKLKEAQQKK